MSYLYIGWRITFKDIHNDEYRVNIYKTPGSSSGTIVQLTPAAEPFVTQEEYGDNVFQPVRIQTGYVRVITSDPALMEQIMPSSPIDRLVRVFKIVNNTEECVWQGYIQQQAFTQPYDEYRWQIEFPVVSLLGVMKSTYPEVSGYPYVSVWQILQKAFRSVTVDIGKWQSKPIKKVTIARFTTGAKIYSVPQIMDVPIINMPSPFYRRSTVYWEEMEVRFNELFFNQEEVIDGDTVTPLCEKDSFFSILEKILRPFGMTIREDGASIIVSCFGMASEASGRHTAGVYDGNDLLDTLFATSPTTDRDGSSDADTISNIQMMSARQTISYILPSKNIRVTTSISNSKDVTLVSMPKVRLDGEVFAQNYADWDPTMPYRIWQLHDPSVSEHPLEQFKFYSSSEEFNPTPESYSECDYDVFRQFINSTVPVGNYAPVGACPALTKFPDAQDSEMHSVIFMRLIWTNNENMFRFVPYEIKSFLNVGSAIVDNMWCGLVIETFDVLESYSDYTLRAQIINNGQYYTSNDTWSDTESSINISIVNGKIYASNPTWAGDNVRLINVGGRSGEFKIRILQGKPEPSRQSFTGDILFSKIEFKMMTPNINNKYFLGFSDNRTENVYSNQRGTQSVKSINLSIGTNMGNEDSPSFIYCPNNTAIDYYKNSFGYPINSLYSGTPGDENYREYHLEETLLNELYTYSSVLRHTRTLAARPFIRRNCLYSIDGLYYMAIEKKRSWVDDEQEIKFIEVAPIKN